MNWKGFIIKNFVKLFWIWKSLFYISRNFISYLLFYFCTISQSRKKNKLLTKNREKDPSSQQIDQLVCQFDRIFKEQTHIYKSKLSITSDFLYSIFVRKWTEEILKFPYYDQNEERKFQSSFQLEIVFYFSMSLSLIWEGLSMLISSWENSNKNLNKVRTDF